MLVDMFNVPSVYSQYFVSIGVILIEFLDDFKAKICLALFELCEEVMSILLFPSIAIYIGEQVLSFVSQILKVDAMGADTRSLLYKEGFDGVHSFC